MQQTLLEKFRNGDSLNDKELLSLRRGLVSLKTFHTISSKDIDVFHCFYYGLNSYISSVEDILIARKIDYK